MARFTVLFRVAFILLLSSVLVGKVSAQNNPFAGDYSGDMLTDFNYGGHLSFHVGSDGSVTLSGFFTDIASYFGSGTCSSDGSISITAINYEHSDTSIGNFNGKLVNNNGAISGSGTVVDTAGFSATWTVTRPITLTIDNSFMSDSHTLRVDATATFDNAALTNSNQSVEISLNLNGKKLDKSVDSSLQQTFSGAMDEIPVTFLIDLEKDGVPRFTSNQQFDVVVTKNEDGVAISIHQPVAILLPVVLIPGIDPKNPFDFDDHPQGGDGTFPAMENSLMQQSQAQLDSQNILGDGYSNVFPYRTLYTLSYDRNNASFAQGAQNLSNLCAGIKTVTYADSVNLVAHSKGCLVTRQFLVSGGGSLVNQCLLACGPHVGSLAALLDDQIPGLIYNYQNLYPVYPAFRNTTAETFQPYANPELQALNQLPLPPTVKYTVLWSNYSSLTKTTRTRKGGGLGLGPGDLIVPTFSQQGKYFDPNHPDIAPSLIPAFQSIPADHLNYIEIDELHFGYFDQLDVQNAVSSVLLSDLS